jgi:hypothetical protein
MLAGSLRRSSVICRVVSGCQVETATVYLSPPTLQKYARLQLIADFSGKFRNGLFCLAAYSSGQKRFGLLMLITRHHFLFCALVMNCRKNSSRLYHICLFACNGSLRRRIFFLVKFDIWGT